MASAAAHGSDSHDAPLLFVLLCESSARLCLPRLFLSARCLRGKVLLSSFSSARDARSSMYTLVPSQQRSLRLSLLLIAFTFLVHIVTLPCYYKREPRSHFYHSYLNFFSLFVSLKFKSFTSFSLFTFTSVSSFTSWQLCSFLPCQVSVNIHLTSLNKSLRAFVAPNGQNVFYFFSELKTFLLPLFPR